MSGHEDFTRRFDEKSASDRSFGWVFTVFLVLVGILPILRHKPVKLWALAASAAFLLVTLVRPTLLNGANHLWMKLAGLLSRIVNPLVMALLFYVVFTPTGWLQRLFGKDLLRLKRGAEPSYWIPRNPSEQGPGSMRNQF